MAARYGGEEFAIILPHTNGSMAVRVAERIREAARQFVFLADEHPQGITVSAGVATFPSSDGVDSPDALIRVADQALYAAKKAGKDRVVDASGSDGKVAATAKNKGSDAGRAPAGRGRAGAKKPRKQPPAPTARH
jgi:predicted signal transduction protein with EAL and GGDEF domain